jgi:hypothetical protein
MGIIDLSAAPGLYPIPSKAHMRVTRRRLLARRLHATEYQRDPRESS